MCDKIGRFRKIAAERLAQEIADEAAWIVIMAGCNIKMVDGIKWWNTKDMDPVDLPIDKEVRYLELRGLLEHHPTDPNLVRVIQEQPK